MAVVAALVLAPAAHAASATSVVMLSDSGDYIGGGVARLYHPGNAQISVSGSTAYLDVAVSGGNLGDYFDLEFAAPPGRILTPGTYVDAQRAPFREAGRPGIDISGDGRGCNTIEGLFEVKAFDVAADGTLQRLWIVYEPHCEGGESALFGEVRIGVPVPDGALVAPGMVRWPAADAGRRPRGDTLVGGLGNDRLFGLAGADCLDGGGGKDLLGGGRGNDIVVGGRGKDVLVGGRDNDVLSGAGGDDVIRGGVGRDTLRGRSGRDVIDCGPGRDVSVMGKGDRYRRCERLVRR